MSKLEYKKRSRRRKQRWLLSHLPLIAAGVLLITAAGTGIYFVSNRIHAKQTPYISSRAEEDTGKADLSEEAVTFTEETADPQTAAMDALLQDAARLAAGYDYDGAISLLSNSVEFSQTEAVTAAITQYETEKSSLVRVDPKLVTHVFFHSLIMDNAKAFDGDSREAGYNQVMTTKNEFLKILESMYERGFVLVRLHDLAYETTGEDGQPHFVEGNIMLPEGTKAFVMSQDDVCYYPYMDNDGFASRIIVGEDGKPTCEMLMDDGTVSVGAYDLIPILEEFIQEHPDFSYKGARAVIAFTGYEGILGYRTAPSKYADSPTFEQDKAAAAEVAQCLRDNGWELASHSWGHRNMGSIPYGDFKSDTDKWENEVESLIGPTDIILFPFGSDIGTWKPYTDENDRFTYLKSVGFRYFCNVDSSQYWVQIGDDHLRQGRRNLDGYRMYYDLIETDPSKQKLSDLFDVSEVFDPDRPTPVPPMA
ncbi:MAG: polysaccharide deacetylase [Lachnospiraceae bacterium]